MNSIARRSSGKVSVLIVSLLIPLSGCSLDRLDVGKAVLRAADPRNMVDRGRRNGLRMVRYGDVVLISGRQVLVGFVAQKQIYFRLRERYSESDPYDVLAVVRRPDLPKIIADLKELVAAGEKRITVVRTFRADPYEPVSPPVAMVHEDTVGLLESSTVFPVFLERRPRSDDWPEEWLKLFRKESIRVVDRELLLRDEMLSGEEL